MISEVSLHLLSLRFFWCTYLPSWHGCVHILCLLGDTNRRVAETSLPVCWGVFWHTFHDMHVYMSIFCICSVSGGHLQNDARSVSPCAHRDINHGHCFFCSCQSLLCITVTCHTSYQWTKQSSLLDNIFICACMKTNLFCFRQFVFSGHFMAVYMYVSLTWPQLHWVFTMHFMTAWIWLFCQTAVK